MQASLRSLRTLGCAAPGRMRGEAVLLRSGLRRGTPHLLPQGEKGNFLPKDFAISFQCTSGASVRAFFLGCK
jgi:hypothetical protein